MRELGSAIETPVTEEPDIIIVPPSPSETPAATPRIANLQCDREPVRMVPTCYLVCDGLGASQGHSGCTPQDCLLKDPLLEIRDFLGRPEARQTVLLLDIENALADFQPPNTAVPSQAGHDEVIASSLAMLALYPIPLMPTSFQRMTICSVSRDNQSLQEAKAKAAVSEVWLHWQDLSGQGDFPMPPGREGIDGR